MPRYVILLHETPPLSSRPTHWDLMLEDGNVLRTWALEAAPSDGTATRAIALPDHRSEYLTYEGPVSGNRGRVTRWDAGEFRWIERNDRALRIAVAGQQLAGQLRLARDDDLAEDWRFEYLASGGETPLAPFEK